MKYDSSMTQFHADIVKVMRTMCGSDNEITKKFNPDDNSPAPLRDYLKAKHGSSVHGWGNANLYCDCRPKELKITVSQETIEFSWSQVTKFIRDNWEEIFKKTEDTQPSEKQPKEEQPTYINKLREKYPKINETDEWFDEIYCPSELLNGECIDSSDEKCADGESDDACQKCWRERCPENVSFADDTDNFEKAYFKHYPEEKADEAVLKTSEEKSETDDSAENQVVVNTEADLQGAFDYSELDNDTAQNLRECEKAIRRETAGYFTLLGAKFKEAQELLANRANGTFEKWYTAMGFKRQTVYNLIQRYDFLGSPTIGGREDTFEALPLTLSYEVSKPDAPAELVEKVLDGDITTNAEYINLKKELDEANKRAEDERKCREAISRNFDDLESDLQKFKDKYSDEYYKNAELEKRIKEFERKPVDVDVQDNTELMTEIEELREENARLKDGSVKSVLIRLTLDEFGRLCDKVSDDPCLKQVIGNAKIIKL